MGSDDSGSQGLKGAEEGGRIGVEDETREADRRSRHVSEKYCGKPGVYGILLYRSVLEGGSSPVLPLKKILAPPAQITVTAQSLTHARPKVARRALFSPFLMPTKVELYIKLEDSPGVAY